MFPLLLFASSLHCCRSVVFCCSFVTLLRFLSHSGYFCSVVVSSGTEHTQQQQQQQHYLVSPLWLNVCLQQRRASQKQTTCHCYQPLHLLLLLLGWCWWWCFEWCQQSCYPLATTAIAAAAVVPMFSIPSFGMPVDESVAMPMSQQRTLSMEQPPTTAAAARYESYCW